MADNVFSWPEATGEGRKLRYVRLKRYSLSSQLTAVAWNRYPVSTLFASHLIRAGMKPDVMVPNFAASFLGHELRASVVARKAIPTSDGRFSLNTAAFASLILPLQRTPSEQQGAAAILGSVDRKMDPHQRRHAALEALFKALLHELMAGEIRVKEFHSSALAVN